MHKITSLENRQLFSRLFVLGQNKLSWYHDIEEYRTGQYIGCTNLMYIYEVMKVTTSSSKDDTELWAF